MSQEISSSERAVFGGGLFQETKMKTKEGNFLVLSGKIEIKETKEENHKRYFAIVKYNAEFPQKKVLDSNPYNILLYPVVKENMSIKDTKNTPPIGFGKMWNKTTKYGKKYLSGYFEIPVTPQTSPERFLARNKDEKEYLTGKVEPQTKKYHINIFKLYNRENLIEESKTVTVYRAFIDEHKERPEFQKFRKR